MNLWTKLEGLFGIPENNPELVRAQISAFSTQVPMLYFILIINTIAVSASHFFLAPLWLTVYLPLPIAIVCIYRIFGWQRLRRTGEAHLPAVKRLRSTVILSGVLGGCFAAWGIALYPYADGFHQAHLAFYMSITVIACVFCLMHVRAAALTLTLAANVPIISFFASTGQSIMVAISINLGLVTLAMLRILFTQYGNFASLIETQKQLISRQSETQALSDQNFRLANLDMLTELPNRRSFFQQFDALLEKSGEIGETFVVALIDLDGFKAINDLHRHAAGDRLLVETSQRLQSIVRPGLVLARLGGDEFAVLINITSVNQSIPHWVP
jgi:predicted signal transduction protein with EAL and GGDEF domain